MAALDPVMALLLERFAARVVPPFETITAPEARALTEELNAPWNEDPPWLAEVRGVEIGGVRARLYRPADTDQAAACVVYLHGGGWVVGSLDTHDGLCRRLALAGGFVVLSVDYALAPEHPFPRALEEALAVLAALEADGGALGVDPGRVAVAGDSAGANLALAAALARRDGGLPRPRAAALVYGVFSDDHDSPSHAAFGDGRYGLTTETMRWFWDAYVPERARRSDPLASPLFADLRGLPPLYLSAAEFDPLRDDTERLARRLVDGGADFDYRLWRGVIHGSFNWSRELPAARHFVAEVAGFLREHLVA